MNTDQMRARLAEIKAELESTRDQDPTDELVARTEALVAEFEELDEKYQAALARDAKVERIRQAALDPKNVERIEAPQVMVRRDPVEDVESVARGFVPGAEMQSRALTLIENTRGIDDRAKASAARLVERDASIARHGLLVGSEAYRGAFETILRYGPEMGMTLLTDEQRYAMRGTALSNTLANGGYTIPFLLDPTVVLTNDGIAGSIRSISRVESGTANKWNGISSAGVTAEWLGEATEAAEAGPTVAQPSISAFKAAANITFSYEQEADGQLVSQLPSLLADAKNRLDEAAFATGNGTTAPKGIVTAVAAVTASRVSPTTGGTFTSASVKDVYGVINAVPPRHRSASSWLANFTTLSTIRQMDTYGGSAFWANLGAAVPNELLGRPVYETSTMTATVTTGSNLILAGDFSQYLIYDRVGMEMRYNPIVIGSSGQRPTGQAQWLAIWRVGADALNPNGFRVLQL